MIVAVTGATEHLGINLLRTLVAGSQQVRALIPGDSHNIRDLGVDTIKGDIRDPYSLDRAFSGADIVYHTSSIELNAPSDWPILESINILGTRNVVESCLKCRVERLVHFSAVLAMQQQPLNEPVTERRPLADLPDSSPYGRSRALAEREIRKGLEIGLDSIILSSTGIISPYDYQPSKIGAIIIAIAQGKMPALREGGFDWVDARDVAQTALQAAEAAPTASKYLLSGYWTSFYELAELIDDITGRKTSRLIVPSWATRPGGSVLTALKQLSGQTLSIPDILFQQFESCNPSIDHARASKEFSYSPRPLEETLKDTLGWYQEAGLLDRSLHLKVAG